MATRERRSDRGTERGRRLLQGIGGELRLARRRLGLSLRQVAVYAGVSASELSRIERARSERVSLVNLARLSAVLGLDLVARTYPGSSAMRDSRHGRLLGLLQRRLAAALRWATEVPLPNQGDQRAWDAMIRGAAWRYGVEAELSPIDGQALLRRVSLKQRDGDVDGVLLLLPDTRQTRLFRREFAALLAADYPVPARRALARLAAGLDPDGNAVIVLR